MSGLENIKRVSPEYFMADFTNPPINSEKSVKFWCWCGDITDDGIIILPTITTVGFGSIALGTEPAPLAASFRISTNGNAATVGSSGALSWVVNSNSDAKFCIGTAVDQNPIQLKNRLGETKSILILFWYN